MAAHRNLFLNPPFLIRNGAAKTTIAAGFLTDFRVRAAIVDSGHPISDDF
jgi:hypothetical protein